MMAFVSIFLNGTELIVDGGIQATPAVANNCAFVFQAKKQKARK
jgi:hypothetical protein